jgi:2-oxoglutarate ferredoxin oxidoreductase subunit beta
VLLDVISPCVTFNDHEGSTKSYAYAKDHDDPLGEITFVPFFEDISVDYDAGSSIEVKMHDGSRVLLKKLDEKYNPQDKLAAITLLHETAAKGEFATGLLYIDADRPTFIDLLNTVETPLSMLTDGDVRPGPEALEEIMERLR